MLRLIIQHQGVGTFSTLAIFDLASQKKGNNN